MVNARRTRPSHDLGTVGMHELANFGNSAMSSAQTWICINMEFYVPLTVSPVFHLSDDCFLFSTSYVNLCSFIITLYYMSPIN